MSGLHHTAHTTHTGGGHSRCSIFFFLVGDDAFCRQEHSGDRCGILQSYARNLGRVNNSGSVKVLVCVRASVIAIIAGTFADL